MGLPVGPPQGGTPNLPVQGQPAPLRADEFKSLSIPFVTTYKLKDLAPPTPQYVTRDDQLLLRCYNSIAGVQLRVMYRILLAEGPRVGQPDNVGSVPPAQQGSEGRILVGDQIFNLTSNRAENRFVIPMAEGFLLALTVAPAGVTSTFRGSIYCAATLARGLSNTAFTSQILISDYILSAQGLGWPGGPQNQPTMGTGYLHSQQVTTPAAGADWTITVPTQARWRIRSVTGILTTNATVVNRIPQLQITDGANVTFNGQPTVTVPASQAVAVCGSPSVSTNVVNVTGVMIPLPADTFMAAGHILKSLTTNLQGADTWTAIWIQLEEWLEP